MDNNELLVKMKNVLDIENTEMIEIFKLGGIELTGEDVENMLTVPSEGMEEILKCKNNMLEGFFNGFITFKRGERELKPGQSKNPPLSIVGNKNINNIMLKKLKIALSLSSQDMLDIFNGSGDLLTKDELSNFFRKEGHKHYKRCNDKHAMNFLEGLVSWK